LSESAPVAKSAGIKGVLARAAKAVRDDYSSGGAKALLRIRACQIIGGEAPARGGLHERFVTVQKGGENCSENSQNS